MNLPKLIPLQSSAWAALLLPLGLWGLVWAGMQGGILEELTNSDSPKIFITRLRSGLPLAAAYIALVIMVVRYYRTKFEGFHFLGPLGLTVAYGVVGLVSLAYSPDASVSLYWVFVYLSVPIVLWGITLGPDALERVNLVINANWIIAIVAVLVLVVLAFSFLSLAEQFLNPLELLECKYRPSKPGQSWYILTDGGLRPTGAGRIAAIAAIIALSYMWNGRYRYLWGFLLVAAVVILLTSGARTSFVGFTGAAIFIVLLHGRLKGLIGLGVFAIVLLPFILFTEIDDKFATDCLGSSYGPGTSLLRAELQPDTPAAPNNVPVLSTTETSKKIKEPDTAAAPYNVPVLSTAETSEKIKEPDTAAAPNNVPVLSTTETSDLTLKLSGRTVVWEQAIKSLKDSPVVGFGFQGDRLVLGTHMHNSYLHAAFQTGILGLIPFILALILSAFLVGRAIYRISWLPRMHQHLVIQTGAMLVFFSARSIPESSGAFFGIDWLIIAPLMLYLQLVNNRYVDGRSRADLNQEASTV